MTRKEAIRAARKKEAQKKVQKDINDLAAGLHEMAKDDFLKKFQKKT